MMLGLGDQEDGVDYGEKEHWGARLIGRSLGLFKQAPKHPGRLLGFESSYRGSAAQSCLNK